MTDQTAVIETLAETQPILRSADVPLSPPQAARVLRARYPDALVCSRCAVLLATRKESYARSWFMVDPSPRCRAAYIDAYVCAECRQELAEAVRTADARRAAAVMNLAAANASRALKQAARRVPQPALEDAKSGLTKSDSSTAVDMTVHPGGRPRKHRDLKRARAAASRAYRARVNAARLSA